MASAADFEVGQEVFVLPGGWRTEPVRAHIRKIARVWVEIEQTAPVTRLPVIWRMRVDTQDEGNAAYPWGNARFFTLEQWEKRERETEAFSFLREQGIVLRFDSPWCKRETELADILREALSKREAK